MGRIGGGAVLAQPARGECARKQRDVGGSDVRALHDASAPGTGQAGKERAD